MINGVFLDASFWVAYRDEAEAFHMTSQRIVNELLQQRAQFVTTLPVVCEIHAFFTRKRRMRGLVLADFQHNPLMTIEDVSRKDYNDAIELLDRHVDKTFSLCDAISFVVMQRLGLKRALSFDSNFRQFGEFEILGGHA